MIECRVASPMEREESYGLWQQVFGDTPQFQEQFYRLCCPQGPLVAVEEGRVVSMLALPPVELVFPQGQRVKGGYLYALATLPEARGKGCAAALIAYAKEYAASQGHRVMTTVPAQPSLFQFFGANGFTPAFYHVKTTTPPPRAGEITPIFPQDYMALRERLLEGTTYVSQDGGQMAYHGCLHGKLYQMKLTHGLGCAAVEHWPQGAIVKEMVCHPLDVEEGGAVCAHLCGNQVQLRTPCLRGEEGTPFGAICWLGENIPKPWTDAPRGYLGLAFD